MTKEFETDPVQMRDLLAQVEDFMDSCAPSHALGVPIMHSL